ncbi:MAG: transmembrane anchor protein [Acidobacteria bacterium]|nr:MAG: transmembrane anchor protein [Acidobacteriota bacterium]REK08542.1 MAG: transmembrane anchor protein [Acidobacteriota bacterium]
MYNADLPSRAELPSSRQLLRSTAIALVVAVLVLVAVVLPAEYGLDPTGIGRVLGLTEMGEIKRQLAAEAEAEAGALVGAASAAGAADSSATPAPPISESPAADAPVGSSESAVAAGAGQAGGPVETTDGWRDVFSRTLAPAEGEEIKLTMQRGDSAVYEWSVDRGHLNSDLHTDDGPDGGSLSYRQGRAEERVSGEFTAASDGAHGWFWRNRSDEVVTVTLRLRGTYGAVRD